jgi:hypothetical protein
MATKEPVSKPSPEKRKKEPKEKLPLMKNPVVYIGAVVLLVFTIFAFVWTPTQKRAQGIGGDMTFGSYAGKPIDYKPGSYFSEVASQISQEQNRNNGGSQNSYYQQLSLWRQAFNQVVTRMGVLHEVKISNAKIAEKRLDKEMSKLPQYLDANGKFSKKKFYAYSDSERANVKNDLRESLLYQDYYQAVDGQAISDKEKAFVKTMAATERAFTFVTLPFSSYPETEIKAYGQQNAKLFRTVKVSYINATSKAQAEKLKSVLSSKKKDFAAVLKNDNKSYTGLDSIQKNYWEIKDIVGDDKLADEVFTLKVGEYSPVYKTKAGEWAFFTVIEAPKDPDFEKSEAVTRAWSYISSREKGKLEAYFTQKAADFSAKAANNFDAACKEFGLTAQKIDAFPLNYGGVQIIKAISTDKYPELGGVDSNEAFLEAAFSVKKGEISKPIMIGESICLLRLDEEKTDENNGAMLDFSYPYYAQQYLNYSVGQHMLSSPLLKDEFGQAFEKHIAPSIKE